MTQVERLQGELEASEAVVQQVRQELAAVQEAAALHAAV